MLKDVLEKLKALATPKPPFDPATLNDPVATQTAWTPLKSGGTNFRTHRFIEYDMNKVGFRASTGAIIFHCIFLLAGLGMLSIYFLPGAAADEGIIVAEIMGLIFASIGGSLLYFGTRPIIFDKYTGVYQKGRKVPESVPQGEHMKNYAMLSDIHAVQLLSEYIRGSKSSYYSYELNLVLKDGFRINVIDHGNPQKLHDDAVRVAQFLGVPLWDAR